MVEEMLVDMADVKKKSSGDKAREVRWAEVLAWKSTNVNTKSQNNPAKKEKSESSSGGRSKRSTPQDMSKA